MSSLQPVARLASASHVLPFRVRSREEMCGQIVHDSIHRREGWTLSYLLDWEGREVGFGSVAIAGPWKDKPTAYEFYLLPEHRIRAFEFFEAFLRKSGARFFEVQTSDVLLTVLLHAYGRDVVSEKIVFHDQQITTHPSHGARLEQVTTDEDVRRCQEAQQGGGEWILKLDDTTVATGGILFHYNRPYGDIYMEVAEPYRRRGFGVYLVQELKRIAYEFGAIPGARCNCANRASRRTLQKAGFAPFAHILIGAVSDHAVVR